MIFSTFFNFFIITIIIGYSYIFKSYLKKEDNQIKNLDLLYGLFILIFLSLVLNFILPLNFYFYSIVIVGFSSFIYCVYKKNMKIDLFYYLLIIFAFIFIIYLHGENVDSPMYHQQIIKWINNYKISLGLSNLEIRFGDNSLWFNFLSLFKFKFKEFNSIYILNVIPFSFLTYEILKQKKTLSYLFLGLSLSFLFFFSYLHPFRNGVILNHLHNPEVDTIGMVFFILSFYLLLMFLDEKRKEIFHLLILSSSICFFIKLSYIGVALFPLLILIVFYRKNLAEILKTKIIFFVILLFIFWIIKNLLVSGCLIFPLNFTCFNVVWSPGVDEIETYKNVIKGFARDTRERLRYLDFNHTIHTFNWFLPWFKDYALNTSLLKISYIIIFSTSIFFFIIKRYTKFLIINLSNGKIHLYVLFVMLTNFLIWFQAPEIRFGWGTIISLNCYLLSIIFYHNVLFEKINPNIIKYFTIFFLAILIFDNKKNFSTQNLFNPYVAKIDYSKIEKIFDLEDRSIYRSTNWKCYDFEEICVNSIKDKYFLEKKFGHLIFTKYELFEK